MSVETKKGTVEIAIVGAGGIGSSLFCALVPALHRGGLVESLGRVRVRIQDSDTVDADNLAHQRFLPEDVGGTKVAAICRAMAPFQSERLQLEPRPTDVRGPEDLGKADVVVVAVDSPLARGVVHASADRWLDLRCTGDGYISIDHRVDGETVSGLDGDQSPRSCQIDGAILSGNIQFGYLAAAAHGAQWVLQTLRMIVDEDGAMQPYPQSASISFGTLGRLDLYEEGQE
jgi:hypothetical protein